MKTRLLLVLAMVLFFVGLVGTTLATPPLPDDMKIIPPDPSVVPPENAAFFGESGKWSGDYHVPMSGAKANVLLVFEEIQKQEARIVIAIDGSVGVATEPIRITANFIRRRGKVRLCFNLSSPSDRIAETVFTLENGILKGERTARGNFGMSTSYFTLKPIPLKK